MTTSSATCVVEELNYCYLKHIDTFHTQRWGATTFFYIIEYSHVNSQLAARIVDGS